MQQSDADEIKAKLLTETAQTSWQELERFFARGILYCVSSDLNLVDVAFAMSQDDGKQIQQFMDLDQLTKVDDAQAKQWFKQQPQFWTVVVAPFVLIQVTKDSN